MVKITEPRGQARSMEFKNDKQLSRIHLQILINLQQAVIIENNCKSLRIKTVLK